MNNKKQNIETRYIQTGYSPLFVLFIVFLVLKLTDTVSLSWWVITLPLWVWFPIFLVFFVFLLIVALVGKLIN